RDGSKESYAASTKESLHIVPTDYEAGAYAVNEVSCNRCHEQTGRQIGEFNFDTVLYGEIWGEDRISSWHPFDKSGNFNGAYHNIRILDQRFVRAGLIEDYDPSRKHPKSEYETLPRPFSIRWR